VNPFLEISAVLVVLGALVFGVKNLQARGGANPETARKLVHMGMGVVCLVFPWIFAEAWPVWILAGLAVAALTALRFAPVLRRVLGGVLYDVNRASFGEAYFPLGVAAVFTLAQGRTLPFVVPVALLTFADAMGALVGKRWGRRKFETLEGQKSVEGSLAVGGVGFLCSAGPLLVSGHNPVAALLIGALMGLFGLILEATSWRGLDNVFLPLAAYAQISVYLGATIGALLARLAVLTSLTMAAMIWRRRHVVDDSARLGAVLAMYFSWVVGGWTWLVAPIVLLVSYVRLMPVKPDEVPRHNLVAVICVSSVGLVWCVAQAFAPDPRWWWLFTLSITAHHAVIAIVRFSQWRSHWPRIGWWAAGAGNAVLAQGIAFWLVDRGHTMTSTGLAAGALCVAVASAGFVLCERNLQMPEDLNARWWKQGISAAIASVAGLLLMNL
jgi:phytol kinase